MPYAAVTDLLDRFDARTVAQYASDLGAAVSVGSLATNTKVVAALDDASARIDAACQVGERYLRADLVLLVGDPDRQKGALIRRITCDMAMASLVSRRMAPGAEVSFLIPTLADSLGWLDRLTNGDAVLDIAAAISATLPTNETPDDTNPYRPSNYNPMLIGRRRLYFPYPYYPYYGE